MSAANYDIVIDQGSDYAVEFQISEDGTPRSLSGYFVRAQIRKSKTGSDISASFVCSISDEAGGKIIMSLGHAISSTLTSGGYFYDMEIFTLNDASVTRMVQGTVNLTQEVTR